MSFASFPNRQSDPSGGSPRRDFPGSLATSQAATVAFNTSVADNPQVVQKFLQFLLRQGDRALIPVETISEIVTIRVPEVLPVPQMRDCVLGVYNWRGEMLWIVDLGEAIGFPSLFGGKRPPDTAIAIAIEQGDQTIGFVVPQVLDLEVYNLQQQQETDPQLFPASVLPFLSGYFIDDSNEIAIAIDIPSVFQVLQQGL
jgi:positive phototaxis protein PixI